MRFEARQEYPGVTPKAAAPPPVRPPPRTNWANDAAEDEEAMLDREFDADRARAESMFDVDDEPMPGADEGYQSRAGGKGKQR
eukprot:11775503-Alexandrium_andersonii.AAC.1